MSQNLYLFHGFASEYVLHPLYSEMKKCGHHCLELDLLNKQLDKTLVDELQSKNVVLITSGHIALDHDSYPDVYKGCDTYWSPLEIISIVNPIRSYYIPHDLTHPLIDNEHSYLGLFDCFFVPLKKFSIYDRFCRVENLGWIKKNFNFDTNSKNTRDAIWFMSDIGYHQEHYGVEATYNKMAPILNQGVAVKFPAWPITEIYEDFFRSMGVTVHSSSENLMQLLHEYQLIITNSESSVVSEAYYSGKRTLNITEQYNLGKERKSFANLNNLRYLDYIENFDLHTELQAPENENILRGFDFHKAMELITANS